MFIPVRDTGGLVNLGQPRFVSSWLEGESPYIVWWKHYAVIVCSKFKILLNQGSKGSRGRSIN